MDFVRHGAYDRQSVFVTFAAFVACYVRDGYRIHVAGFDLFVDLTPFECVADFDVGKQAFVRDFGVADSTQYIGQAGSVRVQQRYRGVETA